MSGGETGRPFAYTPTWVIAGVCLVIVFISVIAERALHFLGRLFQRKNQDALYDALEKLKEELMLLGFISLLLTVLQGPISRSCMPAHLANIMLPCRMEPVHHETGKGIRRLLSEQVSETCSEGRVQFLSIEALHQLHIFIFVLAVVYVMFCVSTVVLGGVKVSFWPDIDLPYIYFSGELILHSWYLWMFVVLFLLMNIAGWHSYFWLSFLPLVVNLLKLTQRNLKKKVFEKDKGVPECVTGLVFQLLLIVGAKLEHIITQLAKEAAERVDDAEGAHVRPSDEMFWFHQPVLVLYLIHFILFQNSFEIAFLLWILSTYGLKSCIMEDVHFIIPRLVIGIIVQVLCSYSTLPLYVLVSQMGTLFKQTVFDKYIKDLILTWASDTKHGTSGVGESINRLTSESNNNTYLAQQPVVDGGTTASEIELYCPNNSDRPSYLNKY